MGKNLKDTLDKVKEAAKERHKKLFEKMAANSKAIIQAKPRGEDEPAPNKKHWLEQWENEK